MIKKFLWLMPYFVASFVILSCERAQIDPNNPKNNYKDCINPTRVINASHKVNLEQLRDNAPELIDSVKKYGYSLQAYHIAIQNDTAFIACDMWYNSEIQFFFAQYGLAKSLLTGAVVKTEDNSMSFDLNNFSIVPNVTAFYAFDAVSKYYGNDGRCTKYTLGIFDESPILKADTPVYTLSWKFEGMRSGNITYVDAKTSRVVHEIIVLE